MDDKMPPVFFMFGQFRWHNGKREKMERLGVAVDGAGLKADKLFGFFAAEKFLIAESLPKRYTRRKFQQVGGAGF